MRAGGVGVALVGPFPVFAIPSGARKNVNVMLCVTCASYKRFSGAPVSPHTAVEVGPHAIPVIRPHRSSFGRVSIVGFAFEPPLPPPPDDAPSWPSSFHPQVKTLPV